MRTSNYSTAVQSEINAINEQASAIPAKAVNKRLNWELLAAVGTLAAIISVFVVLNSFGLIREF